MNQRHGGNAFFAFGLGTVLILGLYGVYYYTHQSVAQTDPLPQCRNSATKACKDYHAIVKLYPRP